MASDLWRARLIRLAQNTLRPLHWRIAGALPASVRRHYLYTVRMGRRGDFTTPRLFSEKVNWRIIHDRRPLVARACDKMAMKELARERVGSGELRIPRTLWSGTDLATLPDLDDVGPWVLKPNHSSGAVILDSDRPDDLARATATWTTSKPAELLGEWGYSLARPVLLLEERVPGVGDAAPVDYKFFCYDGVPRFVQVNSNRFAGGSTATYYTPDWSKLPVRWLSTPSGDEPRPAQLERMLDLAGRLAAGWDFVRVDLYASGDDVWFGEYTPYPGGGMMRFVPADFDAVLGEPWRLPPLNAVRAGSGDAAAASGQPSST